MYKNFLLPLVALVLHLSAPTLSALTTVEAAGLSSTTVPPNVVVNVTVNWLAEPMSQSYKLFLHFRPVSNQSTIQFQKDQDLPFPTTTLTWEGPTSWGVPITVPPGTPNGDYLVLAGLYNANGKAVMQAGTGVTGFNGSSSTFVVATLTVNSSAPPPPLDSDGPVTLDLSDYELTFSEEFDAPLSANNPSNWQSTSATWFAHLPNNPAGFGTAWFGGTGNPPFEVDNGQLKIRAWYDTSASHWRSGLLSSVNPDGQGFSQQYGYFEMRAKFPGGNGTWPAFWMLDTGSLTGGTQTPFEIDVVEQYGPQNQILTTHYHVYSQPKQSLGTALFVEDMSTDFHTYGLMWTEEDLIWYFDGVEVWRVPTPAAGHQPMYLLVDLAMTTSGVSGNNPSDMLIDYVRAYQLAPSTVEPTPVLLPGDSVIGGQKQGTDFVEGSAGSGPGNKWPSFEGPSKAIDNQLLYNKFLNYAKVNVGLVMTPSIGPTVVNSMRLWVGNDYEQRDPATYEIYGTNSTSLGGTMPLANFTLISSGSLNLPSERNNDPGDNYSQTVTFSNQTAYTSYLVVFPTIKLSSAVNCMQIGEIQLYGSIDLLVPGDAVIGGQKQGSNFVQGSVGTSGNKWPAAENPDQAIDGLLYYRKKYLNFAKSNVGLVMTPSVGPTVVNAMSVWVADDYEQRDPATYELYGTNVTPSGGTMSLNDFTLISSGSLSLPSERNNDPQDHYGQTVTFSNQTAYTSYLVVFPTIKLSSAVNCMQIGEVQLHGTPDW